LQLLLNMINITHWTHWNEAFLLSSHVARTRRQK